MLKKSADVKTLIWAALITTTWAWNWRLAEFSWPPFLLSCFWAFVVSSMVHNHVHVSVFKSRILNTIYDYWLTIVYGYPVFAWISTHNKNHHVYNNRAGDFAPSYILSEKNNLFTFLSYPTVSGSVQQKVNFDYLKTLWTSDRPRCLYYVSQFVVLIAFIAGAFALSWKKALLYVVIPQQLTLNIVLFFNYLQHIHCDEESKYNHSRNVLSPFMNFFLLNNGYHTAHHAKPLAHWSELKGIHKKMAAHIDPRLNERSLIWMVLKFYFLAPFIPQFRSFNMRADRMKKAAEASAQSAAQSAAAVATGARRDFRTALNASSTQGTVSV